MKATITTDLIAKLKPGKRPIEVRDTRVSGFILRVQPSGWMSYYVQYRRGKRKKIGPVAAFKPDEARKVAISILAESYKGLDPNLEELKKQIQTLGDFIDIIHEPWALGSQKSGSANISRLRRNFSKYLSRGLSEISAFEVERWRSDRLKSGTKPATVNKDIGGLKAVISRAMEMGLLDVHPLRSIKPLKVDNLAKCRFLDDVEYLVLKNALLDRDNRIREKRERFNKWRKERGFRKVPSLVGKNFADHLHPMVLISLNTGLRRGELFNLKWSDIDFLRKFMTIEGGGTKTGKTRHIPLNSEVVMVLEKWKADQKAEHGLVFVGRKKERFDNVNTSWGKLLKDAGIKNFRWHDMRHTFASRLVMAGVDLNTVRELLGHSDLQMTLRYAHLAPSHTAKAVEKLVG